MQTNIDREMVDHLLVWRHLSSKTFVQLLSPVTMDVCFTYLHLQTEGKIFDMHSCPVKPPYWMLKFVTPSDPWQQSMSPVFMHDTHIYMPSPGTLILLTSHLYNGICFALLYPYKFSQ